MHNFGDLLNNIVSENRSLLFLQGEMIELTFSSFNQTIEWIKNHPNDQIEFSYPIGVYSDGQIMMSRPSFRTKEDLQGRFNYLGLNKLPIEGILNLVTIIETMLNDLLREVLMKYPKKIPNSKKIDIQTILDCNSIEQIKLNIIDSILNEIKYKSPKEFAEDFNTYVGFNLLEIPAYHKYIELKATRDIHIHNKGEANKIYEAKAGTFSRVKAGNYLPVTLQYFLEMYEQCLRLCEEIEKQLNDIWESNIYRDKLISDNENGKEEAIEQIINEAKENSSS